MRFLIASLGTVILAACSLGPFAERRPFKGWLPFDTHVDLGGAFSFTASSELVLALAVPCLMGHRMVYGVSGLNGEHPVPCDRSHLDAVRVVATTPWHSRIPGTWIDAEHIVFRVDWENSDLDPTADDAESLAARPWLISGSRWTPRAIEALQIVQAVVKANAEGESISSGAAPDLEVTQFEISGGPLRAGGASTMIVRITNHGPGTAYGVVAITRSGIASLHGRRLEFGPIRPGQARLRRLRLTVPVSESSPDTMLVLVFGEVNGFSPHNVTRRVQIAPPPVAPAIAVHCSIPGHRTSQTDLDAGEAFVLHCLVDNTGNGTAIVELETTLTGARPLLSPVQDVLPRKQVRFDIPITIPRELAIDSLVDVTVVARDSAFARAAQTTLTGVIRKPKQCVAGELTRAQYAFKLAELRKARSAGDLTQQQFDRYDAELVTCLN